jgi:hypothetical protein
VDTIFLVIPRWFYPDNLGDSVHWTFAPTVIKKEYPGSKLVVFTHGELIEVLRNNPLVDEVHSPPSNLVGDYNFWKTEALTGRKNLPPNMFVLFAEHHPDVWKYWNENFDFLYNHPTANLLYVNSLLQLGMEKYLYDGTDLFPKIYIDKPLKEDKTLAIVPAHKISFANPSAHPGCDGKGFRFNGDEGQSWKTFANEIKKLDSTIKIVEFSKDFEGIGDEHVGHLPWTELATEAAKARVAVLSDGGMHHVFNSQDSDIVLLAAQTINKLYHYASKNTTLYWDLHSKCTQRCDENIRKLNSWEDMGSTCDSSCETVDPILLAEYVYRDFFGNG